MKKLLSDWLPMLTFLPCKARVVSWLGIVEVENLVWLGGLSDFLAELVGFS